MRNSGNEKIKTIEKLIESFFNGMTTLDEERRLYRFFEGSRVPPHLECYRNLFADFGSLLEEHEVMKKPTVVNSFRHSRLLIAISGIAATLLLVFGVSFYANVKEDKLLAAYYSGSYVIKNGNRIDDLCLIHSEIKSALNDAKKIEEQSSMDGFIEKSERYVLDNIDDINLRKQLDKILND